MELFWIQVLAVPALLCHAASASNTTEVIGAVGKSVTFHSPYTDMDGDIALWSFGSDPIVTVQFGDPPQLLFHDKKFKPRLTASERGHTLRMSQLGLEDSGTYSVTIDKKTSTFRLLVYRELAEPTVTCEAQNCSDNGSCGFSLRCSALGDGVGNVSYSWSVRDRPGEWQSGVLLVEKSSQDELEPLTCTARNAVSNVTVTVSTDRMVCPENSTHSPGSDALLGSSVGIGLIAAVGAGLLSLIILVVLWKSKGWTKFHLSKSKPTVTETTTVYAEVGPSQQLIPNGIKPKPRGAESSTTIYSLVKGPEQAANGTVENASVTGLKLV